MQVFLSTQGLLLGFINYLHSAAATVISIVFLIITYRQLFGYSWWGTLWRYLVTAFSSLMMILPFYVIAFMLGDDDRKDAAIIAGPWVIAFVILLIAVMLGVAYLISRHQYKKNEKRISMEIEHIS